MKKTEFITKEYDKFFEHIRELDFTPKKQIESLFLWLFDNDFIHALTKEDLESFYEHDDYIYLPRLTNTKVNISVGIEAWNEPDHFRIGVDPAFCFDKTSRCSIVVEFPIDSKRTETKFYGLMNNIMDTKSKTSREWFDTASASWCGEFGEYRGL